MRKCMNCSSTAKVNLRLLPLVFIFASLVLLIPTHATLLVGVAVRDGVALAADSRLNRVTADGDHQIISENQIKLLDIQSRFLVAMAGKAHIGNTPIWRMVRDIGDKHKRKQDMDAFTKHLSKALCQAYKDSIKSASAPDITLMIAGYQDKVGRLVEIKVPSGKIKELHTTNGGGMAWSGDMAIANRLILGVDYRVINDPRWSDEEKQAMKKWEFRFPTSDLNLADAVELATTTIKTSIEWSRLVKGTLTEPEKFHPTIGGPIDAAVVTPHGVRWIARKKIITE
jgi:Proteasome subunit